MQRQRSTIAWPVALAVANTLLCLLTAPSFQKKVAMLLLLASIFLLPAVFADRSSCLCDFPPILSGEVKIETFAQKTSMTVNFTANYNLSRVHIVPRYPGSISFKRIVLNLESGEMYQELNNGTCMTRIVHGFLFPECVPSNYTQVRSYQNYRSYRITHPSGKIKEVYNVLKNSDVHCLPNLVILFTQDSRDTQRSWQFFRLSEDYDKAIDFNPKTDKCVMLSPVPA